MTSLVLISDTHNRHEEMSIPDGDILIHAGDATSRGSFQELARFAEWMRKQPHRHKIFCGGNHDIGLQDEPGLTHQLFDGWCNLLIHREVEIEGLRFFGSPWTQFFHNWAYNYNSAEALMIWDKIPAGIDVLITHGPPKGILDKLGPKGSEPGANAGCHFLLQAVDRVRPRLHTFGHIHTGRGWMKANGTTFVNASMLDDNYQPVHQAQVFEL